MSLFKASKKLGGGGSMRDRRPLYRRPSSGFDRRNSGRSHHQCRHGRACAMVVLAATLVVMVCTPFILLGPHVVLSINISPRGESGVSESSVTVRGFGSAGKEHTQPESSRSQAAGDLLAKSTSLVARLRSSFGKGSLPSEQQRPDVVARENVGIDDAPSTGDLCLGMAVGISPAQLATFVASFRKVAPQADLVMFFEAPTSERFNDIIDKFDVVSLPIERERLEPAFLRRYHPSSVRWVLFQRFLDAKGLHYERVLMADARQTFFQSNPFDIIGEPGLYTFMDDKLIGESPHYSSDVEKCLGASALARLSEKPAIHSSVCLGTASSAIDYARQMSEGLSSEAFRSCERADVDIGLHNHLLYSGGVLGVLRFDQSSGPMVDVEAGMYKTASDSRVINLSGREVPIVYRYAGNEGLAEEIFSRYIYWAGDETLDRGPGERGAVVEERAGVAASPLAVAACDMYALSDGVDLFKAKCDLTDTRADSLSSCCAACSKRTDCLAFSFDKDLGLCYMKFCDSPNTRGPSSSTQRITSGIKSAQKTQ